MERLPHRPVALAHRQITHPHFAQIDIHVAEHRIKHRLCQLRPRVRQRAQPAHHQIDMQAHHVETPVHRVGNAKLGIEYRFTRGRHGGSIETIGRSFEPIAAKQAKHNINPSGYGDHTALDKRLCVRLTDIERRDTRFDTMPRHAAICACRLIKRRDVA